MIDKLIEKYKGKDAEVVAALTELKNKREEAIETDHIKEKLTEILKSREYCKSKPVGCQELYCEDCFCKYVLERL